MLATEKKQDGAWDMGYFSSFYYDRYVKNGEFFYSSWELLSGS